MNKKQTLKIMRQERILLSLDNFTFLSRRQIQRIHQLGGSRNTCRVMKDMEEYVNWFLDGENIYYLNRKGAERVGSNANPPTKQSKYTHTIMRNDAYIYFKPTEWKPEQVIEMPSAGLKIIPDAYMKVKGIPYFLEIDNTQKMSENIKKIERYKTLKDTGALQRQIGAFPKIIWVTLTDTKRTLISKASNKLDMKSDVYLLSDIQ